MNQLKCHLLSELPQIPSVPIPEELSAYSSVAVDSQVPTLATIIFHSRLSFWIMSPSRLTTIFYPFSYPLALTLAHKQALSKYLPNE